MLKIMLAALLAAVAVPSQAATYIIYRAQGSGYSLPLGQSQPRKVYVTAEMGVPVDFGCSGGEVICWHNGNKITGIESRSKYYASMTLEFDHILTGWPLSAQGFIGGEASGSTLYFPADLKRMTVQQVERDFTGDGYVSVHITGFVPEPSTWAMMIGGFALAGGMMRRRRLAVSFAA